MSPRSVCVFAFVHSKHVLWVERADIESKINWEPIFCMLKTVIGSTLIEEQYDETAAQHGSARAQRRCKDDNFNLMRITCSACQPYNIGLASTILLKRKEKKKYKKPANRIMSNTQTQRHTNASAKAELVRAIVLV